MKKLLILLFTLLFTAQAQAGTFCSYPAGAPVETTDIFLFTEAGCAAGATKQATGQNILDFIAGNTLSALNVTNTATGKVVKATGTATATSFTTFDQVINEAGVWSSVTTNPSGSSTAVKAAGYFENNYNSANSLTGNGHFIGALGRADNTGSVSALFGIGIEGRCDASGTGGYGTCAAVVATFGDTPTGSYGVPVGFYTPDHPTFSGWSLLNQWTDGVIQTAGVIKTSSGDQEVIARDRVGVVTDRYYPIEGVNALYADTVLTRNVAWAVPFVNPERTTWTKIGTTVGTAIASSVLRFGIYKDSAGVPGTLILDAGTVDSSTTGDKEVTISQELDSGIYWLVVAMQGGASDGNITFAGVNSWNVMGMSSSTAQDGTYYISASGALPDPFGSGVFTGAGFAPFIWMRK